MTSSRSYLALLIFCISVPIAFGITYVVSVSNGDIPAFFPYISDTGTLPPASCIFGQFVDIGTALIFFICLIRYYHIKCLIMSRRSKNMINWNKFSFIFGNISCLGLSLVGNFQFTNQFILHSIGAVLSFGGLFIYINIQIYISKYFASELKLKNWVHIYRLVFICLSTISSIISSIFLVISFSKFDGEDRLQWKPTDSGFVEHVISSSSEWVFVLLLIMVFASFTNEFKQIESVKFN
ncbi:unnamed protein product, partial [Brachionus calyciflorus]